MRDILPQLDRWQRRSEAIALATVVGVRGLAPRPCGARLAVTRSGLMAGSVSGGCVEIDVFERALRVLDSGAPVVARYDGVDDEHGFEVGLACGGSIDVLIEPFAPDAVWDALRADLERDDPGGLCVALSPEVLLGRKLAVSAGDRCTGSIDPDIDAAAAQAARRLLPDGGSEVLRLPWREGEAAVFVEGFARPLRLYIIGATHTAIPLCRMSAELGYRVTVIDARGVFASEERFPDAHALVRAWPDQALGEVVLDRDAHVVTLNHDPKFDLPALARALRSEAGYIGALGSRATHARRAAALRELGVGVADLRRIRTPVGLDIGGRTPEEVALSILAEMVATRRGRDGRPLVQRSAPIHADD